MGSIWLLIMVIVGTNAAGNDVTVQTEAHWSNDPTYNTEPMCNEAGKTLADKMQTEVGTNNGIVFWKCQEASLDEMLKGATESAPKANGTAL